MFFFSYLGIKVISNAGGINPLSCAKVLKTFCDQADVKLRIAVITGDDLMLQVGVRHFLLTASSATTFTYQDSLKY